VQTAFGDAINDLNGAHIALDAAPGDVQFTERHGQKIPIHGGPGDPDGDFNAINLDWTPQGYGPNDHGSSYVQVVTWHDSPCPDAATILTYSESTNPDSPFAGDQTELFSGKRWVTERYCRADVLAHTISTTVLGGAGARTAHSCTRASHRRRARHHAHASAHRRKHSRSRCRS
jgi:acyl-homoserine-lactone acylase